MERKNMGNICIKMNKWTFMKKQRKNTRGYHEVILMWIMCGCIKGLVEVKRSYFSDLHFNIYHFKNLLLKVEFKYEHYDIKLNNSFSTPKKWGEILRKLVTKKFKWNKSFFNTKNGQEKSKSKNYSWTPIFLIKKQRKKEMKRFKQTNQSFVNFQK